jgi:hypothetical protein
LSKGPLMKQKVEPGQVERLLNEFLWADIGIQLSS